MAMLYPPLYRLWWCDIVEAAMEENRWSQLVFDFLMTEIDTGLIFASLSNDPTFDSEKSIRNHRNARLAYQTVVRFMPSARLSAEQSNRITTELDRLACALGGIEERS
jgi:hypothetical protein